MEKRSTSVKRTPFGRAAAAVALVVLLGGSACAKSKTTTAREGKHPRSVQIPRPNTRTPSPGPSLPRGSGLPPDTVSLDDLRNQGKTDVLR
jgi:hypothetical protein